MAAAAAGEVIGDALERVGMHPDVAVLFARGDHVGFLGELTATVLQTLGPRTIVTVSSSGIFGGGREVVDGAGVVLWCAAVGSVRSIVSSVGTPPRAPSSFSASPSAFAVFSAAPNWPAPSRNEWPTAGSPTAIVGATVRPSSGSPAVVLVNGVAVGAVALAFDDADVSVVSASRTRPVGPPMVATSVEGRLIVELDGQPALTRLDEIIAGLDPSERTELRAGVLIGVSSPNRLATGTFVANVLGMQRRLGSMVLDQTIDDGSIVELRVHDDEVAGQGLLDATYVDRRPILGALLFVDRQTTPVPSLGEEPRFSSLDEWMMLSPAGMVADAVIGLGGGEIVNQPHTARALIFR